MGFFEKDEHTEKMQKNIHIVLIFNKMDVCISNGMKIKNKWNVFNKKFSNFM